MKSYKIHFIRHGMTQANLNGQYIGRTNMPVCPEGMAQLEELSNMDYPYVEKVYTSSLERCIQTGMKLFPSAEVLAVPELAEMDLGAFEGKRMEDLKDLPEFQNWLRDNMNNPPPKGETGRHYAERLVHGIDKVLQDMMEEQVFDAAVVLSGTAIMTIMALMAFPRKPMGEWNCGCGEGFTALITPQIWLRDRVFESFGVVPKQPGEEDQDWLEQKYYENGGDYDDSEQW